MKLPKPNAIIFDWDNTLVNTWPIIHEALNATFSESGLPLWTFEQTKERVSKSMRDSFPEIFGPNWQEAGRRYQAHYRSRHLEQLKPLTGARDALEKIKVLGLHCVVVSNKKGQNLRQEVTHLGWRDYFENVIGADDAARDKPFADPVHMAFAESDIKPGANVWFIGDSEIDLECAQACGCTAILYGDLVHDHPGLTKTHYRGFPYQAHVKSHADVLALLES